MCLDVESRVSLEFGVHRHSDRDYTMSMYDAANVDESNQDVDHIATRKASGNHRNWTSRS